MSTSYGATIFALSSGSPPAAIAIVRISGPQADAALAALSAKLPPPRRATLLTLRDGDGLELDRALVLRFPAPATATGEDLVELHLHGGRATVAAVLAALGRIDGLRPAQPGEFTRRAFENGRIDLAEAEGLADLLAAETETQRRTALLMSEGALGRRIADWRETVLGIAAAIEAELDFDDEDDVRSQSVAWHDNARRLVAEIGLLLDRPPAERLRDGIRVVVAGPPNAGKSMLINALAGREAAIVSPVAGTTRDVIDVPLALGGIAYLFSDTAGLRETDDAIEGIGVERARQRIDAADILIWLGDGPSPSDDALLVHPQCDRPDRGKEPSDRIAVSAVTGTGLDELVGDLGRRARSLIPGDGEVALNARHRALIIEARSALHAAQSETDLVLAAEELRIARNALDAIQGRAGVEDMLDALFGRFCIGK
ncbi:tRNA uridine-5-carboxymethylaminomethyl(34) synthesis GTPase MnmE [Sphingomonas sp. 1P06PA]|uniref:tRNA uridine-5-carboxymethylaminomethyl(34) synthesis GTPase MnmE n=1 Tax=Sphingomonas sp. 1P06PA TaxID=554121 RepID=UPI0039A70252